MAQPSAGVLAGRGRVDRTMTGTAVRPVAVVPCNEPSGATMPDSSAAIRKCEGSVVVRPPPVVVAELSAYDNTQSKHHHTSSRDCGACVSSRIADHNRGRCRFVDAHIRDVVTREVWRNRVDRNWQPIRDHPGAERREREKPHSVETTVIALVHAKDVVRRIRCVQDGGRRYR